MKKENAQNQNPELEENYGEEYLEDFEYVQAKTLKELETKVRKKIEDYGTIEQNPFWDPQTEQWTQMVLYYSDEPEEEEEKDKK